MKTSNPIYIPKVFLFLTITDKRKYLKVYPVPYVYNWMGKLKEIKNSL